MARPEGKPSRSRATVAVTGYVLRLLEGVLETQLVSALDRQPVARLGAQRGL